MFINLTINDLKATAILKPIEELSCSDFKLSNKEKYNADLIIYYHEDQQKILKNNHRLDKR